MTTQTEQALRRAGSMAKQTPQLKGEAKLRAELAKAWKDIETLPPIELMARNPQLAEFVKHWTDRAEKAEAKLEALAAPQDKSDNYLNGYCTGRTDLLKEQAAAQLEIASDEVPCKTHPDAPHGFNRNASLTEDRYVCDCEYWTPPQGEQPIAYLAWRDGKPSWDEDCVCEDPVYPVDTDDDRTSMPVYLHPAPAPLSDDVGADCTPNHVCGGRMVHLPDGECCDKCGSQGS